MTSDRVLQEKLEYTKGVFRIRKSTDNTMVEMKKDKMTNNDLQNTTQKTKDLVKRTSLKPGVNMFVPLMVSKHFNV